MLLFIAYISSQHFVETRVLILIKMPPKISDEKIRILTHIVQANKIELNGQICTNWEKVISNFNSKLFFVFNYDFLTCLHFKVAKEYSAKSGETLSKKQVRNRYVNRVVKYASQAQSLGLGPSHQVSAIKVNKKLRNPWCVPVWEDFLHFVCPECNFIEKDKTTFIKHAFNQHPRVSEISNTDEELDIKIECDSPVDNAMDELENEETGIENKSTEIEIQSLPLVDNAIQESEVAIKLK